MRASVLIGPLWLLAAFATPATGLERGHWGGGSAIKVGIRMCIDAEGNQYFTDTACPAESGGVAEEYNLRESKSGEGNFEKYDAQKEAREKAEREREFEEYRRQREREAEHKKAFVGGSDDKHAATLRMLGIPSGPVVCSSLSDMREYKENRTTYLIDNGRCLELTEELRYSCIDHLEISDASFAKIRLYKGDTAVEAWIGSWQVDCRHMD
jgi:hypothetical protein